MPGGIYKIDVDRGATYRTSFAIKTRTTDDETEEVVEDPWELAGLAFDFTLWDTVNGEPVVPVQEDPIISIEDDKIILYLAPEVTQEFQPNRRYAYTLDVVYSPEEVVRLLQGSLYAHGGTP